MQVEPFGIGAEDVANDEPSRRKVVVHKRKPRFQALNDDMMWIAEEDIARTKKILKERDGILTDKEHARFIKTAEQLRKLRLTDAELNKMHDPAALDDEPLDEEFEELCVEHGLDPDAVRKVFKV